MPGYLTDVLRFIPSGHILTNQTWSTGISVAFNGPAGGLSQAGLENVMDAALPLFATWWTGVRVNSSPQTVYDTLRVYYYQTGGVTAAATALRQFTASSGLGVNGNPAYVSMCISLRSVTPGPRGRGRNYLPANGLPAGATHQWTLTQVQAMATAHAALLHAINIANWTTYSITSQTAVIASPGGPSANGVLPGTNYPIVRVTCDSLPDTQHRREDKLLPQFTGSATV